MRLEFEFYRFIRWIMINFQILTCSSSTSNKTFGSIFQCDKFKLMNKNVFLLKKQTNLIRVGWTYSTLVLTRNFQMRNVGFKFVSKLLNLVHKTHSGSLHLIGFFWQILSANRKLKFLLYVCLNQSISSIMNIQMCFSAALQRTFSFNKIPLGGEFPINELAAICCVVFDGK